MVTCKVWAKFLVVVGMPLCAILGITRPIAHVLTNEMEDNEVVAFKVNLAILQEVVVVV